MHGFVQNIVLSHPYTCGRFGKMYTHTPIKWAPPQGPTLVTEKYIFRARIFQHQTLIESKLRITNRPPINAEVMVATVTNK